jgi:phage baseplate assembly protein W
MVALFVYINKYKPIQGVKMALENTTYYFDFSKKTVDFFGTKDISVIKNEQAIKEAVINLLSTELGSVPMYPERGVSLNKFLFEPIDEVTSSLMNFEITRAMGAFESRINNIVVDVQPSIDELSLIITISFRVDYNNKNEMIQIDFSKIR